MKIIKEGKKLVRTKRVTCNDCGCIFEVDEGEYQISTQIEVMHDGLGNYNCECSCCHQTVYFN